MDKKYGIAAAITMFVATAYITYNDISFSSATIPQSDITVAENIDSVDESDTPLANTQRAETVLNPRVEIVGYKKEGPAYVDINYVNLNAGQPYNLTFCNRQRACSEWVESFTPQTPTGSYRMTAEKAFGAGSNKELGGGEMQLVLSTNDFTSQVAASEYYNFGLKGE